MSRDITDSNAFQRATLNSEYYRIIVLLVLLGALLVWTVLRSFAIGHLRLLVAQLLLTIVAIGYEAFMLRAVRRAIDDSGRISLAVWVINAFVEAQFPTLTLIILIRNEALPPYQIL